VAREAFSCVVRTSAVTRGGLDDLEGAILRLAGGLRAEGSGLWRGLGMLQVARGTRAQRVQGFGFCTGLGTWRAGGGCGSGGGLEAGCVGVGSGPRPARV
jgi:hypothetical protein